MTDYESRIVTRESIQSLQVVLDFTWFSKKRNPTEEIDLGISDIVPE